MTEQELQVQQKRELEKKRETTFPARVFVPATDIFETDQALTMMIEMPGASKETVEVKVEDDILTIDGRIDFSKYDGLQALYTEYNVGNYSRTFQLSNAIEQSAIKADLTDGVMKLTLPKAERAKPRRINVG
jgi:HSP20 family molecular chaperone IbpA